MDFGCEICSINNTPKRFDVSDSSVCCLFSKLSKDRYVYVPLAFPEENMGVFEIFKNQKSSLV